LAAPPLLLLAAAVLLVLPLRPRALLLAAPQLALQVQPVAWRQVQAPVRPALQPGPAPL
jgi:hypothetical protein